MARNDKGPNISELFRDIFEANPSLLRENNNAEVYKLFANLHPEVELDQKKKQICANKKTEMKKKLGIATKKTKGRRKAKAPSVPARASKPQTSTASASSSTNSSPTLPVLESLEGTLENALRQAEESDPKGLSHAIKYLRRARNLVSLRIHDVEAL